MTPAGDLRIYIDTTIFVGAFEGRSAQSNRLKSAFACLAGKRGTAVTSEFTLAELLGKESEKGWSWQTRFYLDLLVWGKLFDLRPLTRSLLIETGTYRRAAKQAGRVVKLGDAIHAVTAQEASCSHLFTTDKRFVLSHPTIRLLLDDNDDTGLAHFERLLSA